MRRVHAFVNPFSGVAGGSLEIWATVKRLFSIAHVQVDETMTTHQGHAEQICSAIDLETVRSGIVVVSGDGLFHEVVNGLLHREDWEEASKIPLGIIPAGSGNGLARSIQAWNPFQAALAIIKGKTEPLDTWSVIANNNRRFAVLSIEWGTIASIDFDSERVRFLGGARFHLWSFLKLVNRQRYSAQISFLKGEESDVDNPRLQALQSALQQEQLLRTIEKVNLKYGSNAAAKFAATSPPFTPQGSLSDLPPLGSPRSSPSASSSTSNNDGQIPKSDSSTNEISSISGQVPETSAVVVGEENDGLDAQIDLRSLVGPPLRHLVGARTEEEGWETIDADWMMILALNTTHMAHNVQAAPKASISDGLMDLLTISKASRRTLLRMILAMEEGSHMSDPDLSYIKARAFVLKPQQSDDRHKLHGIDGEKCICDGVMVEVHPRLLNIFCDPDALTDAALSNPHSFMSKELQKLNAQLIDHMKQEVAALPTEDDPSSPSSPSSSSLPQLVLDSPKDLQLDQEAPHTIILDEATLHETATSPRLTIHQHLDINDIPEHETHASSPKENATDITCDGKKDLDSTANNDSQTSHINNILEQETHVLSIQENTADFNTNGEKDLHSPENNGSQTSDASDSPQITEETTTDNFDSHFRLDSL